MSIKIMGVEIPSKHIDELKQSILAEKSFFGVDQFRLWLRTSPLDMWLFDKGGVSDRKRPKILPRRTEFYDRLTDRVFQDLKKEGKILCLGKRNKWKVAQAISTPSNPRATAPKSRPLTPKALQEMKLTGQDAVNNYGSTHECHEVGAELLKAVADIEGLHELLQEVRAELENVCEPHECSICADGDVCDARDLVNRIVRRIGDDDP